MSAHWGGPISKVLKAAKDSADMGKVSHPELVKTFAAYFGVRNAAFQFTRFVTECGYDRVQARTWAKQAWGALPKKHQRKLRDQERYVNVNGWWRD